MKKSYIYVLIFMMVLMCAFSGCGANKVYLYVGVSQNCNKNTLISEKQNTDITQGKIKIENETLEFTKNNDKNYDSVYFSFDGINIDSITFQSENAKMLNTNLSEHCYYVDSFSIYKEVTEEELKSEFWDCKSEYDELNYQYDSTKILKKLWDNGEFDDIKNVYFGGENSDSVFLTGSERNKTYDITGIFSNENFIVDETGKVGKPQNSVANYMGQKSKISKMFFQWNMTNHFYDEKTETGTDTGFDSDNIILQSDDITIKYNQGEHNSVRWMYEILYNDAVKNGKNQDLVAEDIIKINVKYTFGQSENYKLNCKLFANGKITFTLTK